MSTYRLIFTNVGLSKKQNAELNNDYIEIKQYAVGSGVITDLQPTMTGLITEEHRADINNVDTRNGTTIFDCIIPSEVGGFYIKEIALFDIDGDCIMIGTVPITYKVDQNEGASKSVHIKVSTTSTNTENITFTTDETAIYATLEDLKNVSFLGEIKAIYSSLDGTYTVPNSGVVDENGWMYCDGSTIPNGSLVSGDLPDLTNGRFLRGSISAGNTGGSDTFTLSTDNLPAHSHSINHSHSASSDSAGAHSHSANHNHSASSSTMGNHAHGIPLGEGGGWSAPSGTVAQRSIYDATTYTDVSDSAGAHSHTVTVNTASVTTSTHAGHSHNITVATHTGNSGNVGNGVAKQHIPKYVDVQYIMKVA